MSPFSSPFLTDEESYEAIISLSRAENVHSGSFCRDLLLGFLFLFIMSLTCPDLVVKRKKGFDSESFFFLKCKRIYFYSRFWKLCPR